MARYEYDCVRCGRFDIRLPIGTAPDRHHCPSCSSSARRAFSPPMLGHAASPMRRMWEKAEKSRDEPDVVTQIPPPKGRPSAASGGRP